jgi:hypothetical protein
VADVLHCALSVCADDIRPRLKYDNLQNSFGILTKKVHGMKYIEFPNSYPFPYWIISRLTSLLCRPTCVDVKFVIRYLRVSHLRCAVSCWCRINMLP